MTAAAPESDPELDRLIAAMQEGRLTRADRDRLEHLLQRPEARGRYRQLSTLHASLLYLWHHPHDGIADRRDQAAASASGDSASGPRKAKAPTRHFDSLWPPAAFIATVYQRIRPLTRPTPFALTIATLTVGSVLAIAAAVRVGVPSSEEAYPGVRRVFPLATLVAVHEAAWHKPAWPSSRGPGRTEFEPGATLAANDRLHIERGLAELAFFSGAKLVVEGPAEVVITGRDSVRLDGGRIVVRTTHGPGPQADTPLFTVVTPRGLIDDLGTEFGVDVPRDGNEGVHVFDGLVSVLARSGPMTSPVSGRRESSAAVRLEAGASVAIDEARKVHPVAHVASSTFVRALPDAKNSKRRFGHAADVPRPAAWHGENVEEFPPIKARFVRFTALEVNGPAHPQPCIDEIEIFATDGRNVALGGTATASGTLPGHSIHAVAHVNDGRYGNDYSWICDRPRGWIQIELPAEATIDRIVWSRDRTAAPRFIDRVPTKYLVSVSLDGTAWQHVADSGNRLPFGSPRPAPEPQEPAAR